MNKHEAMSRASLRSCELSRRIFGEAMLAEEVTMSGADAFFLCQLGVVFS
nr:hypothetical protein [Evansella caseinilytica]